MNLKSMAILVVSCDKYKDLWEPFWKLFKKFWENCKYPLYIGSNYVICDEPGVKTLNIGDDKSWAENVTRMLNMMPEEYVLLLLEDFFLEKYVKNDQIEKLLSYAVCHNVDCLRLAPTPPAGKTVNKALKLGRITLGSPYCVSTQPAIWKKSTLLKLLEPGYSAWDFEIKNSRNVRDCDYNFIGSNCFYVKRHNGVERGKYYASTLKLLKKNGIFVDVSQRGVTNDLTLRRKLHSAIYIIFQLIRAKLEINI